MRWTGLVCALLIGATAPAMAQETLLMSSLTPSGTTMSTFFNNWAQKVNAAAQGTAKVEVKDGITLATFGTAYDRVTADVIQIGWMQQGLVPGKFPLSEVPQLPFIVDNDEDCAGT